MTNDNQVADKVLQQTIARLHVVEALLTLVISETQLQSALSVMHQAYSDERDKTEKGSLDYQAQVRLVDAIERFQNEIK